MFGFDRTLLPTIDDLCALVALGLFAATACLWLEVLKP